MNPSTTQFTEDELETLCQALRQELSCEWDNDEEDYLKSVAEWRADFAKTFVAETELHRGEPGALNFSCDEAREFLERQHKVADLLEKLAVQLPERKVSHA